MTNDLQNIYNSLFRFLRHELPAQDASSFLKDAEANADVASDLETFRAAKVLIQENELLNFKHAAKGYAKYAKTRKLIKKIVSVAAVTIIGGVSLYFISNNNTKNITPAEQNNNKIIVNDSLNSKTDTTSIIENIEKKEVKDSSVEMPKPISNHAIKVTENIIDISDKEIQKMEPVINKDITAETEEKTEIQKTEIIEFKKEEKKNSNSKEAVLKTTLPQTQNNIEQPAEDNSDDSDFWNDNEEKTDPCDVSIPSTYEPVFDDEIIITEFAVSSGSILIYNEQMKEVFKLNFQENTEVKWDGHDMAGEYVPMGLYKIIIFYANGTKCIKDITILER